LKSFLLLIIAGILLPATTYAQGTICEDDLCKPREVVVKTSLTGPLQHAAYLTLGVEVPVYKQFAVQGEVLYIYKYILNATQLAANRNSLGAKIDVKYYIPKSTTLRIYTGPSLTYRNMYTDVGRVEWREEKDEQGLDIRVPHVVMDNATQIKTTTTDILWQVGIQPLILKHFALNLYTGAGVGLENKEVKAGPVPPDFEKTRKSSYFSSIIGLQAGFAF
jgi:hypothetical protein